MENKYKIVIVKIFLQTLVWTKKPRGLMKVIIPGV
jgi:hypothetical protein